MMSRVNIKAGAYGGFTKMGGHITDRSVATHCTEAQPPTHQHLSTQPDRDTEAGPKRSQGSTNGSTFHDPWVSNGLKGLEGLIQAPQAFGSELSSKKGASGLTASDNMHKQLAMLMSDIDKDLEQTASAVARCKARLAHLRERLKAPAANPPMHQRGRAPAPAPGLAQEHAALQQQLTALHERQALLRYALGEWSRVLGLVTGLCREAGTPASAAVMSTLATEALSKIQAFQAGIERAASSGPCSNVSLDDSNYSGGRSLAGFSSAAKGQAVDDRKASSESQHYSSCSSGGGSPMHTKAPEGVQPSQGPALLGAMSMHVPWGMQAADSRLNQVSPGGIPVIQSSQSDASPVLQKAVALSPRTPPQAYQHPVPHSNASMPSMHMLRNQSHAAPRYNDQRHAIPAHGILADAIPAHGKSAAGLTYKPGASPVQHATAVVPATHRWQPSCASVTYAAEAAAISSARAAGVAYARLPMLSPQRIRTASTTAGMQTAGGIGGRAASALPITTLATRLNETGSNVALMPQSRRSSSEPPASRPIAPEGLSSTQPARPVQQQQHQQPVPAGSSNPAVPNNSAAAVHVGGGPTSTAVAQVWHARAPPKAAVQEAVGLPAGVKLSQQQTRLGVPMQGSRR